MPETNVGWFLLGPSGKHLHAVAYRTDKKRKGVSMCGYTLALSPVEPTEATPLCFWCVNKVNTLKEMMPVTP